MRRDFFILTAAVLLMLCLCGRMKISAETASPVLIPDSTAKADMESNTRSLQNAINQVSELGGGTVELPEGNYFFYAENNNFADNEGIAENDREWHVIKCRNQVTISGKGAKTVLYPVGNYEQPTDMFYFADLLDAGEPGYIENADFRNFTVDCRYAVNHGRYTAKGKGFYMVLLKDCDWQGVMVYGSDGTGFGVDCPINCTMTACIAIQCGKQADISCVGASGFGIGYGYSEEESMQITDCEAYGNRKYGFFVENQKRFRKDLYKAESKDGFRIEACMAGDNLYNFGAEYCQKLTIEDCDTKRAVYETYELFDPVWQQDYHISETCSDCRVLVQQEEPVPENAFVYEGVDYSPVFDPEFYMSRYSDIRRAYQGQPQKAFQHFVTYGIKEGRVGNAVFNCSYYKRNYPDLQKAFGEEREKYFRHYLLYGQKEKRRADYLIPTKNGRDYSAVYEYTYYRKRYPDLARAFGDNEILFFRHFLDHGMKEARQASSTFDPAYYRKRYEDLRNAFGSSMERYYLHYLKYGIREKRETG